MAKKGVLGALGKEIRRRREKAGLSQETLAAEAGIHVNALGRLERGIYNPSVLLLDSIAAALKANLSEIFSSIGE